MTSTPSCGMEPAGRLLPAASGTSSSPEPLWEKRTKLFWELNNNNIFCLLPEIVYSICLLTCYPEERTHARNPSHPTLTLQVNPREVFTAMFLALVSSGWPRPGYSFKSGTRWGPLGYKRGIPQVSGSWAFRGTARFAKRTLTTWKYRQVLRKNHEEQTLQDPEFLLPAPRKGWYQQRSSRASSVGGTFSYGLTLVQTIFSLC